MHLLKLQSMCSWEPPQRLLKWFLSLKFIFSAHYGTSEFFYISCFHSPSNPFVNFVSHVFVVFQHEASRNTKLVELTLNVTFAFISTGFLVECWLKEFVFTWVASLVNFFKFKWIRVWFLAGFANRITVKTIVISIARANVFLAHFDIIVVAFVITFAIIAVTIVLVVAIAVVAVTGVTVTDSNDVIGLILVVNCVIIFYYKIHVTVNHKISLHETSFLKKLILEKKHKFFTWIALYSWPSRLKHSDFFFYFELK